MKSYPKTADKREAVEYIHEIAATNMVKQAAASALRGECSLDSALVTAREAGTQNQVKSVANNALGIKD